jgi:hypothetical protein
MKSSEIVTCIQAALSGDVRSEPSYQLGYFTGLLIQVCDISPKGKAYIARRLAGIIQEEQQRTKNKAP